MAGISTNGSLVRTGLMVEPVLGGSPALYKLNFWGLGAQTKDIMIDCGISGVIVSVYLSTHFYLQCRPTSLSIQCYLFTVCMYNIMYVYNHIYTYIYTYINKHGITMVCVSTYKNLNSIGFRSADIETEFAPAL